MMMKIQVDVQLMTLYLSRNCQCRSRTLFISNVLTLAIRPMLYDPIT